MERVLINRLRAELKIKSWKHKFCVQELKYVREHINHGSHHIAVKYNEAISVFKPPATVQQLLKDLELFK